MLLFVDNLTNVDFSYLDDKRGIVGETWLASIEMEGTLDHQGMVCDFGIVKKTIRDWLDSVVDHCLLVPKHSQALEIQESLESYNLSCQLPNGKIHCQSPKQAISLIDANSITPNSLANWCVQQLMPQFPDTVKKLSLNFVPENIPGPYYHYSHGLKKHNGNCQRIAHGHRSKIEIWRNGILSTPDMELWASRFRDIYVGTREDLINREQADRYEFKYTAEQGDFYLSIDKDLCYLIDTDSTVELIAKHIAETLKKDNPEDEFKVKAFEGIGKGAIVVTD